MTGRRPAATRDSRGLYFFLSYANPGRRGESSAYWVRSVFDDLCRAVRRRSSSPERWDLGFVDQLVAPRERSTAVSRALGTTEVFVPLYSLRYLRSAGPMNERATFLARIEPGRAEDHVVPVLWEPPLTNKVVAEFDEAVALAPHVAEYAASGLLGLRRMSSYRESYDALLGILSERIVQAAETTPIGAGAVRPVAATDLEPAEAAFVVVVLAPTVDDLPHGRRGDVYGARPADWRPFGPAQAEPVGDLAARGPVSHRFATDVVDFGVDEHPFRDCPGFLLIDPWILDTPNGRERLRRALDRLPVWAMPLIIADERDAQYGDRGRWLSDEATSMCGAGRQRLLWRRDIRDANLFDEFVSQWVVVANRHYDRHFRPRPSGGPYPGRPRLGSS